MAMMRFIGISLLVMSAGCGYATGFIRDSRTSQVVEYRMDVRTQRHVRSVSGTAGVGSALCFIPLGGETYKRAMDELYAHADLRPNQALMNIREDHATRVYVFYCYSTLTISADVVEFSPRDGTETESAQTSSSNATGAHGAKNALAGCLLETLSSVDIEHVIRGHHSELLECRSEQYKREPSGVKKDLVVRWKIQPTGETTDISIEPATLRSSYI